MFDCPRVADELDGSDDPRLDERYLRCLSGTDDRGSVLLIGVVHDHPASVARVSELLDQFSPDTLAVELPPLAMGLFRLYAADAQQPPRLGGEMSAAIQRTDATAIGVDAPTRTYLSKLLGTVRRERPSLGVLGGLLRDLGSMAAHALACRVAGAVAAHTPIRLRVYSPIVHDSSLVDPPEVQADDERAYLDKRAALFGAIQPPESTRIIDDAREDAMGDLLDRARADGSVVAVLGMEHLDPVEAALNRFAAADGEVNESR